jgi:hypothetical protein
MRIYTSTKGHSKSINNNVPQKEERYDNLKITSTIYNNKCSKQNQIRGKEQQTYAYINPVDTHYTKQEN